MMSYHRKHILYHITSCVFCLPNKRGSASINKLKLLSLIILLKTCILVNCIESLSFQIPDQQAFTGKLFYYKIPISSLHGVKHIDISEAGFDHKLPDWLYFNEESSELIGIPNEKGMFFIQVEIQKYDGKQWNDIFALEVGESTQNPIQASNHETHHRCMIKIKQSFKRVKDVWRIISLIAPSNMISEYNSHDFHDWLKLISISSNNNNNQYLISIEEENCGANNSGERESSQMKKLRELGIESDVVKVTRTPIIENDLYNDLSSSPHIRLDTYSSKRNHYRRQVADAIHATPIIAPDWMTLSTSTLLPSIDSHSSSSEDDLLSRVLIPSMTSPTLILPTASQMNVESYGAHEHQHRHHQRKYFTPILYTTPVLAPERPPFTEGQEELFTPILVTQTPTLRTSKSDAETTLFVAPSPTIIPVMSSSSPVITTQEETTTPTMDLEKVTIPSSIPNKPPYIHKRLRKLELIAGKYWKHTIPSDTFVDFEDGDTRKLKLTFLMPASSSGQEQPPSDYWIQFDHENQYLYALPTEDNVGKHTFNLVAVDSSGAHVTENVEVHVRQNKLTRAFTHSLTLHHVSWDPFQFVYVIEAVSSLARRITSRIYGDSTIQTIAVQNITRNERDNTWSISWTNESLPTHPCPRELIEDLFAKLHDPDKVYEFNFAEPSRILRQTIAPEFRVQRVQLQFIAKSACGSFIDQDPSKPPVQNPIFRNRISRIGPYKLGEAFRYKIPDDTVYSPSRQVGTRELSITIRPLDSVQFPDFLYYDPDEQEIYGLAFKSSEARSHEFYIFAEDSINGGSASDIFAIEIVDEPTDESKHFTFEVTLNLFPPNGRSDLTIKEKVEFVYQILAAILSDDVSSLKVLSIRKFQFDGLARIDNNYLDMEPENNELESNRRRRSHRHGHRDSPAKHRHVRDSNSQYFIEYTWTNRSIVGQGNCPKEEINSLIVSRIFKREYDSLKFLKDSFEPNYELINVEFRPLGVCKNQLFPLEMGHRPLAVTTPPSTVLIPTSPPVKEDEGIIDMEDSNEFLLTTIIPPVAILIALIFAAIVGCCFHRANRRRKSVEISSRLPGDGNLTEREAFLQKGRIPIIFEFEQQQQQQHMSPQQQQQYNLIAPVIMPPSQQQQQQQQHIPSQQMTPMRQLSSKSATYQPLSQGSQQRRPPPYYK